MSLSIRCSYSSDFTIVQNDTYQQLTGQIIDDDTDLPIDISGSDTIVRLRLLKPNSQIAVVRNANKTGGSPAGSTGMWYYQLQSGDLDIVGRYEAEVELTISGRAYTPVNKIIFDVIKEF